MSRVMITGGCGFLGSQVLLALREAGHEVALFDRRPAVFLLGAPLYAGDAAHAGQVGDALRDWRPATVVHFAGRIEARESVERPLDYFHDNVGSTIAVLQAMREQGIDRIVFASTGSVYGGGQGGCRGGALAEDAPLGPVSPYARSKLMAEDVLAAAAAAHGIRSIVFRFFNAAGADPAGRAGELHEPETHLIPLVLAAALGRGGPITVLGRDHPTPDGTCIRDYIHVADIAEAVVLAARALGAGQDGGTYNLGSGRGHSVLEVIEACGRATGRPVPTLMGARRAGDPAILVADAAKARAQLGWTPTRSGIDRIVTDALAFFGG